ncbi:hypothetical protein AHAS_Ahas08G0136100 [Arachis hypogaea]
MAKLSLGENKSKKAEDGIEDGANRKYKGSNQSGTLLEILDENTSAENHCQKNMIEGGTIGGLDGVKNWTFCEDSNQSG